jgi:hypothetical protein
VYSRFALFIAALKTEREKRGVALGEVGVRGAVCRFAPRRLEPQGVMPHATTENDIRTISTDQLNTASTLFITLRPHTFLTADVCVHGVVVWVPRGLHSAEG